MAVNSASSSIKFALFDAAAELRRTLSCFAQPRRDERFVQPLFLDILDDWHSARHVFEHFRESEMAELDENIPGEFYADDKLQELIEQNRQDFASVDEISERTAL